MVRIGEVRRRPTGAEQHANRHVVLPKRHRFAERVHVQPFNRAQVSGRRQPVGASANNCYVAFRHVSLLKFEIFFTATILTRKTVTSTRTRRNSSPALFVEL
jgi:hypothetical protein